MSSKTGAGESCILLDSQSAINKFCNSDWLEKIHKTNSTLRIRCNAGIKTTNYKRYLSRYGWGLHYPGGMANIMYLGHRKKDIESPLVVS